MSVKSFRKIENGRVIRGNPFFFDEKWRWHTKPWSDLIAISNFHSQWPLLTNKKRKPTMELMQVEVVFMDIVTRLILLTRLFNQTCIGYARIIIRFSKCLFDEENTRISSRVFNGKTFSLKHYYGIAQQKEFHQ